MQNISTAAAGLCKWVSAVVQYHRVYKIVGPKQIKLADAEKKHNKLMTDLLVKQKKLKVVQDRLDELNADLTKTRNNKEDLEHRVEDCKRKLMRAE